MAFSCGARSAFKLREKDYLRNMLSRRQLEGFVGQRPEKTLPDLDNKIARIILGHLFTGD